MANNKLLLVKNMPLEAIIVVKEEGSPTPVELLPGDTAKAYFVEKSTNEAIPLTNGYKELIPNLTDPTKGEFTLNLTANETQLFPTKTGFIEDGSKARPVCKCLIDTQIANLDQNAKAILYDVFIEDFGL